MCVHLLISISIPLSLQMYNFSGTFVLILIWGHLCEYVFILPKGFRAKETKESKLRICHCHSIFKHVMPQSLIRLLRFLFFFMTVKCEIKSSVKWDGRNDERKVYLIGKRLEFITVALETLLLWRPSFSMQQMAFKGLVDSKIKMLFTHPRVVSDLMLLFS